VTRLPKLTNGTVIRYEGRPIPRALLLHDEYTVEWSERRANAWRSYTQPVWATSRMSAQTAWEAWYEKSRRREAECSGWQLVEWAVTGPGSEDP